jgi:E3 ubiquitin-protein ligase UBR4
MTFSGEQGQAIRQLIGAHVLRRVAMCCLASPKGKRQHLAVSHEKGKVSVYTILLGNVDVTGDSLVEFLT